MTLDDPNLVERVGIRVADKKATAQLGEAWTKAKAAIDGKKTAIGLGIVLAPQILEGAREVIRMTLEVAVAFGVEAATAAAIMATIAKITGGVLAAIGVVHKILKGLRAAGVLQDVDAPASEPEATLLPPPVGALPPGTVAPALPDDLDEAFVRAYRVLRANGVQPVEAQARAWRETQRG